MNPKFISIHQDPEHSLLDYFLKPTRLFNLCMERGGLLPANKVRGYESYDNKEIVLLPVGTEMIMSLRASALTNYNQSI